MELIKSNYDSYLYFRDFKTVDDKILKMAINHICLNLNHPGSGENYKYFYDMYSYATKCQIVLQKYNKTKLGEAICDGKLINFLEQPEHKNCSCGSVYYNYVF